jgi:hypothetical protein
VRWVYAKACVCALAKQDWKRGASETGYQMRATLVGAGNVTSINTFPGRLAAAVWSMI